MRRFIEAALDVGGLSNSAVMARGRSLPDISRRATVPVKARVILVSEGVLLGSEGGVDLFKEPGESGSYAPLGLINE